MPTRIAYLGPAGTYGEQASRALADLEGLSEVSFLPCAGLRAVVECLAQAGADAAVVPVENSVEGGVTATLDALWAHSDLCIRRALVRRSVMPCMAVDRWRTSLKCCLTSALAQCSGWLAERLPVFCNYHLLNGRQRRDGGSKPARRSPPALLHGSMDCRNCISRMMPWESHFCSTAERRLDDVASLFVASQCPRCLLEALAAWRNRAGS